MDDARTMDLPEVEVFGDVPAEAEFACASDGPRGRCGLWLLPDRIVLLRGESREVWPLAAVRTWSTRSDGEDFVLRLIGDGAGEVRLAEPMRIAVTRALRRWLGRR